jgi:flagellar biosynthetic protein FliO
MLKLSILAMAIWQANDAQIGPEQFQSGRSLIWTFIQTIVALGFVCLLAYVLLRYVLPRVNVAGNSKSMVRVIDRTPIDQRRSLLVVEVTGRWLLLGSSEAGMHLISELDPEKAEQEVEARKAAALLRPGTPFDQVRQTARTTFADVLARMGRRR